MNKHASTLRAANALHGPELARIFGAGGVEAIALELDRLDEITRNPKGYCGVCGMVVGLQSAHPGHCAECG